MALRLKVDEDLPAEVCELFQAAGHDARGVRDQGLKGAPDDKLWPIVQREQRVLVTADKGFGNALKYPVGTHAGVVLFRHPRESRAGYIHLADELLAQRQLPDLVGAIVVVTPDGIRVYRGSGPDSPSVRD